MAEPAPVRVSGADQVLLDRAITRRAILLATFRPLVVVALTLLIYALVPIQDVNGGAVALLAGIGLVAVGAVFVWRLALIPRSARPVMAAIEALVLVFGMFLCLFALVYVALATDDPTRFTQPINKVSAVYFSVTVLATVGFGDIAAVGDLTRTVVTIQMVLDLVLIGAAVKLLAMSARAGVLAQHGAPGSTLATAMASSVAHEQLDPVKPAPAGETGPAQPEES